MPTTDIEAMDKFPKYTWVYETGKVLSMQKKSWSIYKRHHDTMLPAFNYGEEMVVHHLTNEFPEDYHNNGYIFCDTIDGNAVTIDTAIHRGTCKWHFCYDQIPIKEMPLCGDLAIRLNAFSKIYFSKYSGFASFDMIGQTIVSISLSIDPYMIPFYTSSCKSWQTKMNKLYSGKAWGK